MLYFSKSNRKIALLAIFVGETMSFSDFWTNENNPSLPKSEYLYNTRHIIVLVVTFALCILLTLIFYKKSERAKRILLYVIGGIFVFLEILSRVVYLSVAKEYTFQKVFEIIFPMHICPVMVWVYIAGIFSRNKVLLNFGAVGGFIAALAFLLYPAVGLNRVHMSFNSLYSTGAHMLGFITAFLLISLGIAQFEMKKIWQTYVCFGVMFSWGALVSYVIFPVTDYMYMVNDPLEMDWGPIPYHVVYLLILAAYVFLFYSISWVVKRVKLKKQKN